MSSLIAVKQGRTVVLATDSRVMNLTRGTVLTDSAEKLFEIAENTFFATSGNTDVGDWLLAKARELVVELDSSDPRILAPALSAASLPRLQGLVCKLIAQRCPDVEKAISGSAPLHGFILAGLSGDVPGFVAIDAMVDSSGKVTTRTRAEVFELPIGREFSLFTTRGTLVYDTLRNGCTWRNGPVVGVNATLTRLAQRCSQCGGPVQMIKLTASGSKWIHRPPVQPVQSGSGVLATAAMATGVTMNAAQVNTGTLNSSVVYSGTIYASQINWDAAVGASLQITNGYQQIKVNPTDYVKVLDSTSAVVAEHTPYHFQVSSTANAAYAVMALNSFDCQDSSGNRTILSPLQISMNGNKVVGVRQTGPGNTTDSTDVATRFNNLLTALRAHGLIT